MQFDRVYLGECPSAHKWDATTEQCLPDSTCKNTQLVHFPDADNLEYKCIKCYIYTQEGLLKYKDKCVENVCPEGTYLNPTDEECLDTCDV